jgi:hypothetical protein
MRCTQKKPLQLLWSSGLCWEAKVLRNKFKLSAFRSYVLPIAGTIVLNCFSVDLDLSGTQPATLELLHRT